MIAGRRPSTRPVIPSPSGQPPARLPITGTRVRLLPLPRGDGRALARQAARLHAAGHAGDAAAVAARWRWLPYGPFADAGAFARWLADLAPSADPLMFAIEPAGEAADGAMAPGDADAAGGGDGAAAVMAAGMTAGMAGFLNIRPADGVLEIGHIWFGPRLQRTAAATEALFLLLAHGFDDLGYRRVEWKCDAANAPSRQAALRLGFVFEGIFFRHMVVKSRNRDSAWFSIIDEEWPAVRAALAAWLAPANFDAAGRQRLPLAALRPAPA